MTTAFHRIRPDKDFLSHRIFVHANRYQMGDNRMVGIHMMERVAGKRTLANAIHHNINHFIAGERGDDHLQIFAIVYESVTIRRNLAGINRIDGGSYDIDMLGKNDFNGVIVMNIDKRIGVLRRRTQTLTVNNEILHVPPFIGGEHKFL